MSDVIALVTRARSLDQSADIAAAVEQQCDSATFAPGALHFETAEASYVYVPYTDGCSEILGVTYYSRGHICLEDIEPEEWREALRLGLDAWLRRLELS